MEVNKTQLTQLLGVSMSSINSFQEKGMPFTVKSGRNLYDVAKCVRWYVDYQIALTVTKMGGTGAITSADDIDTWKAEEAKYSARKMKYQTLKLEGTLITLDEAEKKLQSRLNRIRQTIMPIEHSWVPYLMALENKADVHKQLKTLVTDLMTALQMLPDEDEGESTVEEDDTVTIDK